MRPPLRRLAFAFFLAASAVSAALLLTIMALWACAALTGPRVVTRFDQEYDAQGPVRRHHALRFEAQIVLYRWSFSTYRGTGHPAPRHAWQWAKDSGSLETGSSWLEQHGFIWERWSVPWAHGFRVAVPYWTLLAATGLLPALAAFSLRRRRQFRREQAAAQGAKPAARRREPRPLSR